jgi:hypothetical protein
MSGANGPTEGFWDRVAEQVARQDPEALRESCLVTTVMHGAMGNNYTQ